MKYIYYILIIGVTVAAKAATNPGIVVNEYYSGSTGTIGSTAMAGDDYIEFALTKNITSATLAALTFGDTNSTTSALSGVFQFDKSTLDSVLSAAGRTSFLAGTIIVVKGANNATQELGYSPSATNATNDGAWSIQLVAGQGAKSDSDFKKAGDISLSITGDAVWISTDNPPDNTTDTSGFVSGLAHSSGSLGTIGTAIKSAFGSSHILSSSQPYGSSVANTGTDSATVLNLVTGGTMATPNGGLNTVWIDGLRVAAFAVPEPGRASLLLIGASLYLIKRHRPHPHTTKIL